MTGPHDSASSPPREDDGPAPVPPPFSRPFGEPTVPGGPDHQGSPAAQPAEGAGDAGSADSPDRPIWDPGPDPATGEAEASPPTQPARPAHRADHRPVSQEPPAPPEDYGYYGGYGKDGPPFPHPLAQPGPQPVPPPGPPPAWLPPGPAAGWPGPQAWPAAGLPAPGVAGAASAAPAPGRAAARPGGVPGWLWPVVAVLAVLTGLVGGVVGGALVSGDEPPEVTTTGSIPVPRGSPAPLPAGNASIAAVADKVLPSTVQVLARGGAGTVGGGTGSGFVVDRRGHVITNNHVVARATEEGDLVVVDHQGRRHPAQIVGRSPVYDIAVLAVERGRRLPPAAVGAAAALRIGDTVVAIGSPLGLSSTVTSGIVSAVDRPVTTGESDASSYINAVQTDAAINPGNSGGPLVNLRGEVVGVNSAIATTGTLTGEAGSIGVGFAIPMEQVRVTANQILATGKAEYPVIGADVDTQQTGSGAKVVEVPDGTPADSAGLREGDVVVAVEGQRVNDGIGLIVAIRSHRPGETITLTVRREGRQRDVAVRLDSKVG